jgi:hypothetical protein
VPQFDASFIRLVAQVPPSPALHVANPALHAWPQVVPSQVAVAFAMTGHAWQLDPQLAVESFSTHAPLHECAPVTHASPHRSSAHVGVASGAPGHTVQLGPQAVTSSSETHVPPHALNAGLHSDSQTPATQRPCVRPPSPVHTVPQAPQFFGSSCVSVQLPLHVLGNAGGQLETHPFEPHTGVSPPQLSPQAVQLAVVPSFVSQPATARSQSAKPVPQAPPSVVAHAPCSQVAREPPSPELGAASTPASLPPAVS